MQFSLLASYMATDLFAKIGFTIAQALASAINIENIYRDHLGRYVGDKVFKTFGSEKNYKDKLDVITSRFKKMPYTNSMMDEYDFTFAMQAQVQADDIGFGTIVQVYKSQTVQEMFSNRFKATALLENGKLVEQSMKWFFASWAQGYDDKLSSQQDMHVPNEQVINFLALRNQQFRETFQCK